jgi:hypothetical protein
LGSEKYAERNWERGIPVSRAVASLCRHLMQYQQGCVDEDHIAAIFCNAMFIAHTEEMVKRGVLPQELLDMPSYEKPPEAALDDDAIDAEWEFSGTDEGEDEGWDDDDEDEDDWDDEDDDDFDYGPDRGDLS